MKKNKILVLGYFGFVTNQIDGQTTKTRNIYNLLKTKGSTYFESIDFFDTQLFKERGLTKLGLLFSLLVKCDVLVYVAAQNNLRRGFPLIFYFAKLTGIKIHYFVVGGWLNEFLRNRPFHRKLLSRINGIYPESDYLKDNIIKSYNFRNVKKFNNFKNHFYKASINKVSNPLKIVFMARVNPMKGVDTIFNLEKEIEKRGINSIIIDLYGPILKSYKENFFVLEKSSRMISYKGIIQPEDIHKTLNKYDLMILPTKYYTEGFPGSILDAYIAGLPVVVSEWKHAHDFIENGETGIVYKFDDEQEFFKSLFWLIDNPHVILKMKRLALLKSKEYSPEKAWSALKSILISKEL